MDFAAKVLKFYRELKIAGNLPPGVEAMNPYQDAAAFAACTAFYQKFYGDNKRRYAILGINPGRYGAGVTGIPFTDPVKLEKLFGITNGFQKKRELSADFIHMMIEAFGGSGKFFGKFFINSVSPLGFVLNGKNLNYYDTPSLRESVKPFICESLQSMRGLNLDRKVAFCLGEGANYKYLSALNRELKLFETLIPLAHPRFIMQYKRKYLQEYVDDYVRKLSSVPDLDS